MPSQSTADLRDQVLANWQEAINDQEALLRDPTNYVKGLTDQAYQAHARGHIGADDLRELLEWADAALSWAEQ
jgi:hypothetical protein